MTKPTQDDKLVEKCLVGCEWMVVHKGEWLTFWERRLTNG